MLGLGGLSGYASDSEEEAEAEEAPAPPEIIADSVTRSAGTGDSAVRDGETEMGAGRLGDDEDEDDYGYADYPIGPSEGDKGGHDVGASADGVEHGGAAAGGAEGEAAAVGALRALLPPEMMGAVGQALAADMS
jgi:hypothetical protein